MKMKFPKLELHVGDDYSVIMTEHETTENASIVLRSDRPEKFGGFIVQACNSHYQMLEALEEVERVFRKGPASHPADEIRALEWVRKAIAKAKGDL